MESVFQSVLYFRFVSEHFPELISMPVPNKYSAGGIVNPASTGKNDASEPAPIIEINPMPPPIMPETDASTPVINLS